MLISEAPSAYCRSASRLFWKGEDVNGEGLLFERLQGAVDEDVALFGYLEVAQVAKGNMEGRYAKLACKGDDGLRLTDATFVGHA